jgi:hypothetical protein
MSLHGAYDDGAPRDHRQEAGTDGRSDETRSWTTEPGRAIEPAAKSEPDAPAKVKATPIRGPPVPAAWYSLREFAAAHRLSMAMLYKLKAEGRGPRETAVGSRRFITFEDAAAWRSVQQETTAAF